MAKKSRGGTDRDKGYQAGKDYKSPKDTVDIIIEAIVPGTIPTEGKSREFKEGYREGRKSKK